MGRSLAYQPVNLAKNNVMLPDLHATHPLFRSDQRRRLDKPNEPAIAVGDTQRDCRRLRLLWLLPCPRYGAADCPTIARMQEVTFQCDASLDSAYVDLLPACYCANADDNANETLVIHIVSVIDLINVYF